MNARECRFLVAAIAALGAAQPATAQRTGATLTGNVTDRSTGNALRNAEIILVSDSRSVRTDSLGNYVFPTFPAGVSQLIVRREPFPVQRIDVELSEGQELSWPIVLDSTAAGQAAQDLPAVGVTAPAPVTNYRLADFERRRRAGRGHYLTEQDIIRSGANTLTDAVRVLRGVGVSCSGYSCFVQMARAPRNCPPDYFVDGRVDNLFGPSIPIRDVVAVEVYTGAADVPGEFAGSNAACGVVVMWTRAGPAR